MKQVILCGMPGSGKSTLAKILSSHWGIPWYDLDQLIEDRGTTISDLFAVSEDAFRQSEAEVLRQFLTENAKAEYVLALGGGTLEREENLRFVLESGTLCFLDVAIGELADRLSDVQNMDQRPLFRGLGREEIETKLMKMLDNRMSKYLQSRIITGVQAFNNPELFTKRVELFTKKR